MGRPPSCTMQAKHPDTPRPASTRLGPRRRLLVLRNDHDGGLPDGGARVLVGCGLEPARHLQVGSRQAAGGGRAATREKVWVSQCSRPRRPTRHPTAALCRQAGRQAPSAGCARGHAARWRPLCDTPAPPAAAWSGLRPSRRERRTGRAGAHWHARSAIASAALPPAPQCHAPMSMSMALAPSYNRSRWSCSGRFQRQ